MKRRFPRNWPGGSCFSTTPRPLLLGLVGLAIVTCLALAPSVYAFARHQRERIRLTESLVVGGIFLLVLASVGSGLVGFYVNDADLQAQATPFAGTTFFPRSSAARSRIWINIDVSRIGDSWQIDHIGWQYSPRGL